jgi:hypothetical protein
VLGDDVLLYLFFFAFGGFDHIGHDRSADALQGERLEYAPKT